MKKRLLKILFILSIIIIYAFLSNIPHMQVYGLSDIIRGADSFIQAGDGAAGEKIGEDKIEELSDMMYNILFVIAVIVAVIVGLIIGIQFMTSGVEQKAKIKETLIPYVAGCIVVFGAFGIWKLVVTLMQSAAT